MIAKTKKWGNSLGVLIPSDVVKSLNLSDEQEIIIDIKPKTNVLREMFGFAKGKVNKPTEQIIREARKELGAD